MQYETKCNSKKVLFNTELKGNIKKGEAHQNGQNKTLKDNETCSKF